LLLRVLLTNGAMSDERWGGEKNKKTHSRDCGLVFIDAFSSAVVDRAEERGTSEEK
jgi:hypothetical protein